MFTTSPLTLVLTGYRSSMCSHGLSFNCLRPRATFSLSLSTLSTLISISSSMRSSSDGWPMRSQLMSVMWSRPSMPPRSTNAPNSAMFLTTPRRTWPTSMSRRRFSFAVVRSSSISFRREMTMFLRSASIFRIFASISRPMNSPMSPGRRMSTCDAGRNTGYPMSTSSPPLIFRMTRPRTVSPSFFVSTMRCQFSRRSALRFDSTISPLSDSIVSSHTSTTSPMSMELLSSHSPCGMTPSLLRPTSTTTSSPARPTIRPFSSVPALRLSDSGLSIESMSSRPVSAERSASTESSSSRVSSSWLMRL